MRRRPIPAWAARRNREREAEREAAFQERLGTLIDATGLLVDVVWSNYAMKPYCLSCRGFAPAPAIDLAIENKGECCAHCGLRLDAEARKAS